MIINGDCLEELKNLPDESVDAVISDPPYGSKFMSARWDIDVPSVDIWRECLRVLKPGAFICVMSAPRSDVQNAMISRLMEAGFRLDFTPIYWTYATGFPKAGNIGKLVDKRLGVKREILGVNPNKRPAQTAGYVSGDATSYQTNEETSYMITEASSPQAKALDGSYAGFQPKPAVEVVIIAMKPLSEKTYVDQALKNGKGITWLDDCRVPTDVSTMRPNGKALIDTFKGQEGKITGSHAGQGRFPANLLVSDDVLNDGRVRKVGGPGIPTPHKIGSSLPISGNRSEVGYADSGSYSRYFDLDAWARERLPAEQAMTFPFAIFPKASKSEKNKGLGALEAKRGGGMMANTGETMALGGASLKGEPKAIQANKNHHPTVKPLRLMSYLITLFSREGDTVLDPFVGSGTTVLAAKQLGREGIGIEREAEYAEIARARVEHAKTEDDTNKQLQLID